MAKHHTGSKNRKFRSQKPQNVRITENRIIKRNAKKTNSRPNTPKVQDARTKIIQTKRKTVVDARDVLSKMAKTQDARNKINKMRDGRTLLPSTSASVKVIGTNILRKTDRHGKISLVTNKAKPKSDINVAIQKQLGLIPNSRLPPRKSASKRNAAVNTQEILRPPVSIRKTILNDMDYNAERLEPIPLYDPALYRWTKPGGRGTASQMINSLEVTRQAMREALREELSNGWPTYASHNFQKMTGIYNKAPLRSQNLTRTQRLVPSGYVDLDEIEEEEMPLAPVRSTMNLQGTSRVSNVHSRLDNSPSSPESHGIFSQTKVVVPAGHRIVVSNLQQSVTQDDIKELFEDIGQLLAAKLVRPGVAEVIYKNLKDAQKAVDTYHNRQLDGQPMKCLLVNKRPLNYPTAPPITKSESNFTSRKLPAVSPCPPTNKLVPDIGTIHKVLFHRK
ncbi:uncharacterized protein isoform X2 [Leptinotarsa decemlineata]|uniref:uncharacterized protein isoform X2 n=1 Tax=Leptinotarsa decemlineata TaxID=7539 RepID=UPI000C255AE8|nr:uncharacterized protein LOC111506840 isoform X2 [Leptinotarsa decemlineata]